MKQELDINALGVIVKGLDTRDILILRQVLTEGIKPQNKQATPRSTVFTVVPDYSSFSMVGRSGYAKTATSFLWGASEGGFIPKLSVVLSPDYVREHISDFIAAGEFFKPGHFAREVYEDKTGQLPYGLEYREVETNHYGELYGDEILSLYVDPEAIVGLIAPKRYVDYLKKDVAKHFSNRNLAIFDVSGQLYR